MKKKPTPQQRAAAGEPIAYMRPWTFRGENIMDTKKAERPTGWIMHDLTQHQCNLEDVALIPLARFEALAKVAGEVADRARFECKCQGRNLCMYCEWAGDIETALTTAPLEP